jgi:hypothetical protein
MLPQAQTEAQIMPHDHLIMFNLIIKLDTIYNNYNLEDICHEHYPGCFAGTALTKWHGIHGAYTRCSRCILPRIGDFLAYTTFMYKK